MRFVHTLRFKLLGIYLIAIAVPLIILAFVLPFYSQGLITRETEKLTQGTVNSLARNIETYFDDLDRLTSSPYLNDNVMLALKLKASNRYDTADDYTRLQTDRALSERLPNNLINTRKDILSTIMISANGNVFLTSKVNLSGLEPNFAFQSQDWYKQALQANGRAAFISSHPQNYLASPIVPEVFSVARLIKDPDSGAPLAVFLADADTVVLETITQDVSFNVSSIVVILDENKRIIYANHPVPEDVRKQLQNSANPGEINNPAFVTVSKKLSPANWDIAVLLSSDELKAKVRWFYVVGILITVAGLIVTFFIFHYFSRWIVMPFKRMNDVMQQVRKGNLHAHVTVKGKDEIAQLGESFNEMIDKLDELINREYKAVLAQRNAEYRALQSQVQPHFLYNTLNGFIGLNRAGETKKLESAVLSLSGMLRYSLEGSELATLKEEFEFLRKYAMLQQFRFEERLTIAFELDPAAGTFLIPRLLLQPIVENAIIHGVEPTDEPCKVQVSAFVRREEGKRVVRIEISDNGVGFEQGSVDLEPHIGLSNVQARLRMFDEHAGITIGSKPGAGTHVTITIPTEEKHP